MLASWRSPVVAIAVAVSGRPAELEGGERALAGAEVTQHYLVLLGLVGPAVQGHQRLRLLLRLLPRAEGGQAELGLALCAPEALRVQRLPGHRLHLLQRVHGLTASHTARHAGQRAGGQVGGDPALQVKQALLGLAIDVVSLLHRGHDVDVDILLLL